MPWYPLPRIAFAVAIYPFHPSSPNDLPLELGDELYIIEQGGVDGAWCRGYLVAPPSLLAGLTSVKGQTLEARVFSGIFPRNCVEIREVLGDDKPSNAGYGSDDRGSSSNATPGGGLSTLPTPDLLLNGEHALMGEGSKSPPSDSPRHGSGAKGDPLKRTKSERRGAKETSGRRVSRSLSSKKSARPKDRGGVRRAYSQRSNHLLESRRGSVLPTVPFSALTRPDTNGPKPPAPVPMLKVGDETPTSLQEPLVDEIASCLREWHSTYLHELLLAQHYQDVERLSKLVKKLDLSRRRLLHNVLTDHELIFLREEIVWDLVNGNKLLCGEVIVRDPAQRGRILTSDDSAVTLSKLQAMMSVLNERPVQQPDMATLHHLHIAVKSLVALPRAASALSFYLCIKSKERGLVPVTEAYTIPLLVQGGNASGPPPSVESMKCLFTNLSPKDGIDGLDGSELCLVVKIMATELVTKRSNRGLSNGGPPSREGSMTSRYALGLKASLTDPAGTLRNGRRSLMWAQRGPSASYWKSQNQQASRPQADRADQPPGTSDSNSSPPLEPLAMSPSSEGRPPELLQASVTRVAGVGVLRLSEFMRQENETEQIVQIWSPAGKDNESRQPGEGWQDTISELLGDPSGHVPSSAKNERISLQLYSFLRPDAEMLIKKTPTLLFDVKCAEKIGFSSAPAKGRSDIYLTLTRSSLPAQTSTTHAKAGQAFLPGNKELNNLTVTMEVRRASGEVVENCIFPASNTPGLTTWQSSAIRKGESWNQVVKLALGVDLVRECHVFLAFADAPDEACAFCWMPLWDVDAFVKDGLHDLPMYAYDAKALASSPVSPDNGSYQSLPWNMAKIEANTSTPSRASIGLRSYLCSTVLSQDQVILGLLSWRQQSPEDIIGLLRMMTFVPEIEIVKLLKEVLDALFSLLEEHSGNDECEDLVFQALVTILSIVPDRRFNIMPLLDQYTKQEFSYPFVAPCLIRSFTRLFADPAAPATSRRLHASLKVGHHIVEFILIARKQQSLKEAGIGITSTQPDYARELQAIFSALADLMRSTIPALVGSQTLAVQHFHSWIPVLDGPLTREEVVRIVFGFIDACEAVKGKLILYKLVLINSLYRLNPFNHLSARRALVTETVRWLAPYWGYTEKPNAQWRDQIRLCCSILSSQLTDLSHDEIAQYVPKLVDSYCALSSLPRAQKDSYSLLFPTVYPFPNRPLQKSVLFDEALVEISAVLAAIWNFHPTTQLNVPEDELAEFISSILQVQMSILQCEAFPASWISLHIAHHSSAMKALEYVASNLTRSFLPHPDDAESFHTDLWRAFFTTLLKLVSSDALALETFPEQKRRAVWKIAGDVREQGADLLRRSWDAIGWETSLGERRMFGFEKMGGYQVQYVPGLVCPIIELCLSVHEGLRVVAVKVLQSMIISEWTLNQDLYVLQAELIDSLDRVFKTKRMTESVLQKVFIRELVQLFEPAALAPDDPLNIALQDLLAAGDEFIDLLVAVQSSEGAGDASHITHTLRLLEFLKDMRKEDIFVRYVHQLARIQIQARNFAEAGLALRHHADLYSWDPAKMVRALHDPEFPKQSSFQRKERLYIDMIDQYEQGKAWHLALTAYRELADQYQYRMFDFVKLAGIERAVARIHRSIAKGERNASRYFRVCFKGLGFSTALRDKQFIYDASPAEKLSAFTDRLQQTFPAAQLISGPGEPQDVEGQFLQVFPVSLYRDMSHAVFQQVEVPQTIREHVLSAAPRKFVSMSRKLPVPPNSKHHQQQQQPVVERTVYTTAETFPTILKRSQIEAAEDVTLSPLQIAVERTVRKTQELAALEHRAKDGSSLSPNALLEALAPSVDVWSETGIAQYRALLPGPANDPDGTRDSMDEKPPLLDPLSNALKVALIDHALVVKRCLAWCAEHQVAHDSDRLRELTQNFEISLAPELASLATLKDPTASDAASMSSLDTDDAAARSPTTAAARAHIPLLQSPVAREPPLSPKAAADGEPLRSRRDRINRFSLSVFTRPSANNHNNSNHSNSNNSVNHNISSTGNASGGGGGPTGEGKMANGFATGELRADDEPSLRGGGGAGGGGAHSRNKSNAGLGMAPSVVVVAGAASMGTGTGTGTGVGADAGPGGGAGANDQHSTWSRRHSRDGSSTTRERSVSSQRPPTSNSNLDMLGSSVASMKKRLSLLRLGRKNSKTSVHIESLREEN